MKRLIEAYALESGLSRPPAWARRGFGQGSAEIAGAPMIVQVWRRAQKRLAIVVAAAEPAIVAAVEAVGGEPS